MTTVITPIIETVIKSSVILGFTYFATLALRKQSAALRHTAWTIGLLCSLALPLFSLLMPAWHVESIRVAQPSPRVIASQPIATEFRTVAISPPVAVPFRPSRFTPERLLFLIWVIGVLSVASLLLREAIRLARVAFGASAVEQSTWRELVRDVSGALALTRRVRLIRNPATSVLGTWGTLRPRVLLPRESESWSSDRMFVVLGHELAHVKRNDWLIQIIAETARTIYWFNPLYWIACTHLRRESEHACDDTALRLGVDLGMDGPTYAAHVLDLARTLKHSGQPTSAALAMASTSNLERRLVAMLNPSLNRRVTGWGTAAAIAFVALALTLPLAGLSSQAPVAKLSMLPLMEPAPQRLIQATPTTPVAVQRIAPRTVAAITTVRPVVEAVPAPPVQTPTATLSGTVTDQTGALIPGVIVSVTADSTGIIRRIYTNSSGSFAFAELPVDKYSATAELPGFQRASFSYLVAEPGAARFNLTLHPAPMQTVVDIASQAPPGLRCFSVFGAVKSDGTPFTAADCPGGTIVTGLAPKPTEQAATVPPPAFDVRKIDFPVEAADWPTDPVTGRRLPIRVGGDLQAATLVSHANPTYPSEARNKGVEGVVVLAGTISKDGHLQSLKVISSSNPLLETSVAETISGWTYKPALLNKEPIEVTTVITLNFTLGR